MVAGRQNVALCAQTRLPPALGAAPFRSAMWVRENLSELANAGLRSRVEERQRKAGS